MTVALVLTAEPDAGLRGQLTSLGVRRVDATDDAGSGSGLLAIAAAARASSEPMLICGGDLAVPRQALARLLDSAGTAGYAEARDDCRAILVDPSDLRALAEAAEYLAAQPAAPDQVSALMGELARRGVDVEFVEARPDGDADRDEDGLVAELFADPIARDVAAWAGDRALTPAALLGISLGLGLASAIWFTEPIASAKAMAAVTLLAAFVCSRSGRLLARSPGPVLAAIGSLGARAGARAGVIQPAGDWLAAAGWAITECAVYAGLAASAGLGDVSVPGVIGGGPGGAWHLAVLALAVVAIRRMTDLGYERATEDSGGRIRLPRSATRRRLERALTLPAGERALVVIVVGGIWGPRIAFMVLIAGGVLAIGYLLTARAVGLRDAARYGGTFERAPAPLAAGSPGPLGPVGTDDGSISLDAAVSPLGGLLGALTGPGHASDEPPAQEPRAEEDEADDAGATLMPGGLSLSRPSGAPPEQRRPRVATAAESVASFQIAAYRDDGPISLWLGRLVAGRIPPVPPLIVGLFVTCALAALGMGNLSGVLLLTPVEAMLLAGLGSSHPHDGPLDWLVPAAIQAAEYLFLAALAFTHRVPPPLVFALVAAVVLRHLDVAYRARHRIFWPVTGPIRTFSASYGLTWPPTAADGRPADMTGLGWEIRMLVLGIGAALGVAPAASVLLAGYLWVLLARDFLTRWLGVHDEPALTGPAAAQTPAA
jgi:hypothetical protein